MLNIYCGLNFFPASAAS